MLERPEPSWSFDSFEPLISNETMSTHVLELHQGYVDKLNKWSQKNSFDLSVKPSEILMNLSRYLDEDQKDFFIDMMGGHVTHTLLWKTINPESKGVDYSKSVFLNDYEISQGEVKKEIIKLGLDRFGSGWVWGVLDKRNEFKMYSTLNHNTPYMRKQMPLFCIDLWEHAYFIDRHGDRKSWLNAVCEFIDFNTIDEVYSNFLIGNNILDHWCLKGY